MQLLKDVCAVGSPQITCSPQGTLVRATDLGIAKLDNDKHKHKYIHKDKDILIERLLCDPSGNSKSGATLRRPVVGLLSS